MAKSRRPKGVFFGVLVVLRRGVKDGAEYIGVRLVHNFDNVEVSSVKVSAGKRDWGNLVEWSSIACGDYGYHHPVDDLYDKELYREYEGELFSMAYPI